MIPNQIQKFIPKIKKILPFVEVLSLLVVILFLLFKENNPSLIGGLLTIILSMLSFLYVLLSFKEFETKRETFSHKITHQIFAICVISTLFQVLKFPTAQNMNTMALVSSILAFFYHVIFVYILKKSEVQHHNMLIRLVVMTVISIYNFLV